MSTRLSKSAME